MHTLVRTLSACAITVLMTAQPSLAGEPPHTTSVWGYSGLVLMPTAEVHDFRDFSLGAHFATKLGTFAPLPFVSAGVFEGLEATVLYGVPLEGFSGLTGCLKYQLVKPTRERPTAVAVGLNLLGVNGIDRYIEGNNFYMVVSQDFNTTINNNNFTLLTGHFGFEGNLTGARVMAGLELPVGNNASVFGDFLGPLGTTTGFFNVGVAYRPLREWQVRAYTMGYPNGSLLDRDYAIGVSYWGNMLGKPQEGGNKAGVVPPSPRPRSTPKPSPKPTRRPTPVALSTPTPIDEMPPQPSPTPSVQVGIFPVTSPTPQPQVTEMPVGDGSSHLRGALIDDKGRALPGWNVGVPEANHWSETDLKGRYTLELPLGPYQLTVRDPAGKVYLVKPIRLVTSQGMELPLIVSLPVGDLKGMVVDKRTKQGLSDASVQLFRSGENYTLVARDTGAFFAGGLPAGAYRMVVTRPRYQPYESSFTLEAKQEYSALVALEPKSGALTGRVASLKGEGQQGVTLTIPKLNLSATTDRNGSYLFGEVPAGQHELIVTQGQHRISTTLVRIRSDETTAENVTVTTASPPVQGSKAGQITGLVTDANTHRAIAGVKIVVEGGDLTVLTITSADGRYAIGDLPPGRYKVKASHSGYAGRTAAAAVTAKAGAVVNLTMNATH